MPWTSNVKIPSQNSKSSPALAAFNGALHMVHAGDSSNDIWHSIFDGSSWNENVRIPDQRSKAPSALAVFQNRLHITHLGDSSNRIWHSSYDATLDRWTTNEEIEGELSQAAPAMTVFQNELHLLHIGNSSHRIYHLVFDGTEWRRLDDVGLDGQRSKGAVALAVFDNELHMVHQGDTSNRLWHTRFDGGQWTTNVVIDGQLSKSPPVLATFNGLLHLLHLGDSSNRIWHSTFSAGVFQPNIPLPYQLSKAAPGLSAFANRLHMTHLGDSSNDIWHSSSDGVLVRRPDRRVVVVDLDGLRWDSFYKHLKVVRDAGANTDVSYTFTLPPGASDDTILGDGNVQLRSALGELCFGRGNGMADVRLALAPYPSFTFPSHGTMYTGNPPGEHGITGHTFVVRDAPPEWDRHSWDSLPRGLALQGYCTDAEGELGALADYLWGGFDTVGENSCRNRNRGLVSDLRVVNMFERAHEAGLRSCSIHSFYHGAPKPWTDEGKDEWWRYGPSELRSVKDICSEEDVDQLETVDHGSLAKADLLIDSMPSKVRVTGPVNVPLSIPAATHRMTGERLPLWQINGEPHPDGIPDLIAIYLASIDNASHIDGIDNQRTYLAWFDHRLARLLRRLREADPDAFENTVFAFVADHGHSRIAQDPDTDGVPSSNPLAVREELVRMLLGDTEGQEFLDLVKSMTEGSYVPAAYDSIVADAIEDDFAAYAEAMNLYVYIRNTDRFSAPDVARRLLAIPMRTEPYGALVLQRGQYQFLARGDRSPVPLTSQRCREVVTPQLDVPVVNQTEIEATSLTDADRQAEENLRSAFATDAFGLLRVVERVSAFEPEGGINQSPDVILLARAERSFSKTSGSTHGSFAYPPSRIPMVFCGPGVRERRTTIETAQLVDFAPTILSLLGVSPTDGIVGRPLLDRSGVPAPQAGDASGSKPAPRCPPPPRKPAGEPRLRRLPKTTIVLHPKSTRKATDKETTSQVPVLVAVTIESSRARRQITLGEPFYVEADRATALVAGRDDTWMEWDGKRQTLKTGTQIPLDAAAVIRVRSARSFSAIELQRTCVVVPLEIAVPRVPEWLRHAFETLARNGRILIDQPGLIVPGTVLASAEELEQLVQMLDARLTDPDSGQRKRVDPRTLVVRKRRRSDMEAVQRTMRLLGGMLDRGSFARFDVAGQMCTK